MGKFTGNKQPFYHRAVVLFTSTTGVGEDDFINALVKAIDTGKAFKGLEIIADTIDIEEYDDPEPGDPADLM